MMSPEIRNSRVGLHFSAIERNEFSANRFLLLFVFCQFRTVFERRYVYVRNGFLFVMEKVGSKLYINSARVGWGKTDQNFGFRNFLTKQRD